MVRKRKTPQRKCIVTNETKDKDDLIRIVRNKEGEVFVDPTGKLSGRGAYLMKDISVIEKSQKNKTLNRHLKTNVDDDIYDELKRLVAEDEAK
ncbi:MAG TPA: YlxR family protein [Bacillota bacterium]|nr:YlxR family protein [Bacillota bacterium]